MLNHINLDKKNWNWNNNKLKLKFTDSDQLTPRNSSLDCIEFSLICCILYFLLIDFYIF